MNIIQNAIEKVSQSFPSIYSKDDVVSLLTGIDIEVKKEVESEIVDGIVKQIEENKHLIVNDDNREALIKEIQCSIVAEIMPKLKERFQDSFDDLGFDDIIRNETFSIRSGNEVEINDFDMNTRYLASLAMDVIIELLESEFNIDYDLANHMIRPSSVCP
jgi:hypothetical protein